MQNFDDVMKHYGVKGMKWGVIRNRNRPGGADGIVEADKGVNGKKRGKLRRTLDSLKRERQWRKAVEEIDKMSTKDINALSKRISLENDLKRYSRTKGVGTKKDREDYLRRDKMSDQELQRKVTRLKAKNALNDNVNNASKEQREFGERIFNIGSDVALKYAKDRSIEPKDVFTSVKKNMKDDNPNKTQKKNIDNLQEKLLDELLKKPNNQS